MREDALLAKANVLRIEVTPFTVGALRPATTSASPPPSLAAFSALVDAYEQEIGKPGTARSQRKAQGAELRPRYAAADEDLGDMDDLFEELRDKGDSQRQFVETYFNLRRLGAGGSDGSAGMNKGGPAKPTPPAP
jgi:hypothetical protein